MWRSVLIPQIIKVVGFLEEIEHAQLCGLQGNCKCPNSFNLFVLTSLRQSTTVCLWHLVTVCQISLLALQAPIWIWLETVRTPTNRNSADKSSHWFKLIRKYQESNYSYIFMFDILYYVMNIYEQSIEFLMFLWSTPKTLWPPCPPLCSESSDLLHGLPCCRYMQVRQ